MKWTRAALAMTAILSLTACATQEVPPDPVPEAPQQPAISAETAAKYGALNDNGHHIDAVPTQFLSDDKARQTVNYWTEEAPGTIIVDPYARYLYHVLKNDKAVRYTVAVGAAGYGFTGEAHIPYQRDWPSWMPTDNMLATNPELYGPVADGVEGGLDNPLGARALYLHNNQGDTFYRIHGTMDPSSIGQATSAGCIRLFNQDIIHLAEQTDSMTKVIVLTEQESGKGTVPPGQVPPIIEEAASSPASPPGATAVSNPALTEGDNT
ncbi:L,D-transpeptidase [Paracoccus sp. TK19116]|uniref:L,D-transpeptidase n=1 Tax=Paracoccus albicereus TaxID=2922394 RepID=A0ABT1MUE3_9RHOB|nr:L,D-transpeptidase [Paracoccus albicereus]MCQ0971948.1 L,D-transpeptidase [Paracoccus albicereus]